MDINILKCIFLGLHTYSEPVRVDEYTTEKRCLHCPDKIVTYNSSLTLRKNMIIAHIKNDSFIHAKTSLDQLVEDLGYKLNLKR